MSDNMQPITDDIGTEIWKDENGCFHREDGPAVIYADGNGEKWFKHGKLHREDGPAKTLHKGYKINYKKWFIDGALHREGGPAMIGDNGEEHWYRHGQLHREDGPAVTYPDGTEVFYINHNRHRVDKPAFISPTKEIWYHHGKIHREGGPALLQKKALDQYHFNWEEWRIRGKLHRVDGPAMVCADGTEKWYFEDRLHRKEGPAVIYPNGSTEWWQNDRLHRENGAAVMVAPEYFIFHGHCVFPDDHPNTKFMAEQNLKLRKNAQEIHLNNMSDTYIVSSRKGKTRTESYTYKYIGRGRRVLANQYWKKGDFLQQDGIFDELKIYEDLENKKSMLKEKNTYVIDDE